jgi:hypothetical protein
MAPSAAPTSEARPTDRAPDDDRQADRHAEEGRRGELHHQRVEHAGEPAIAGRDAEDEVLVGATS